MNVTATCSNCLRATRVGTSIERLKITTLHHRRALQSRFYSLSPRQLQDAPQDPKPQIQPPPITTGTVTANVTSTAPNPPSASPPRSKIPDASTAEIQRHLTSQLGRTRGATLTDNLAQKLRKTAKSATESYITYGLTEALLQIMRRTGTIYHSGRPADEDPDEQWPAQDSGSTWSQVTYLHMYLLTVRMRALDDMKQYRDYQRYLIEHFSNAAEDKMAILHTMNARGIRNRYLKDLFIQWRGLLAAYDEGLVQGDAVLAAAVWRNIWKAKEDVDWVKVAAVVAYMRRAIHGLGTVPFDQLVPNLDGGRMVWEEARRNVLTR